MTYELESQTVRLTVLLATCSIVCSGFTYPLGHGACYSMHSQSAKQPRQTGLQIEAVQYCFCYARMRASDPGSSANPFHSIRNPLVSK